MTHSFKALGTIWWIEIFDEMDTESLDVTFADIEHFVAEFENRYSRFKPDSLISQLNSKRILNNPDPHCMDFLTYGKSLFLRTGTHFNILTGHILEARGYDANYSFTPKDETRLTPGNPVADLSITPDKIELQHGNIDVGGYGKGYLIDEVATRLQATHQLEYFVINAGGDIYASSKHEEPVEIYLEHPLQEQTYIQKTPLLHQGFAASSPFKRQWKSAAGTVKNHIVQHNTASIATFVKADSACVADVFATVSLVCEPMRMKELVETEKLAVAFYDPNSNQLTSNESFFGSQNSL
jgi:thiamine biosynthesis lipoprotein